jgi:hypothetical protein
MDTILRDHGLAAIRAIEAAIGAGPGARHEDVRQAVLPLVAFRDRAVALHVEGAVERDLLDRANALVSLAYGAQFPLAGMHLDRLEDAREHLQSLLEGQS